MLEKFAKPHVRVIVVARRESGINLGAGLLNRWAEDVPLCPLPLAADHVAFRVDDKPLRSWGLGPFPDGLEMGRFD